MIHKSKVERSVILAGSGRSGTSWLGSILNSYERAEYFYEITAFQDLDFGHPDLLKIKYPLTHAWTGRPNWAGRLERSLLAFRARHGPAKSQAQRSLRIFADHRFRKGSPDTYLYKIVTLYGFIQQRQALAKRYGDRLKVIHLIRNPYSQIASELRIDARDPERSKAHFRRRVEQILGDAGLSPYHELARVAMECGWVFQMALVWRVSNEIMLREDNLDKRLVVYERLCNEPLDLVSDLFSYLGWQMSDQTVRYIESTSDLAPTEVESGNFSLRKNARESINRWHRELNESAYAEASNAIAGSELLHLWDADELKL